jgi:hypothetical protein
MEPCRECRFASIIRQQCRKHAPQAFAVLTNRGPVPFTAFPGLPPDGAGCGEFERADLEERERRDREHPITEVEIPAPPVGSGPRLVT